jgi:hypothetical protein
VGVQNDGKTGDPISGAETWAVKEEQVEEIGGSGVTRRERMQG